MGSSFSHKNPPLPSSSSQNTNYNNNNNNNNNSTTTKIGLCTPPGMRNLGATCYLNSQFQCLASNPVFLKGVLSWTTTTTSTSTSSTATNVVAIIEKEREIQNNNMDIINI